MWLAYLLNRDWLFFQVPVSSSGAGAGASAVVLGASESDIVVRDGGFFEV
jgi:hypothetical protein